MLHLSLLTHIRTHINTQITHTHHTHTSHTHSHTHTLIHILICFSETFSPSAPPLHGTSLHGSTEHAFRHEVVEVWRPMLEELEVRALFVSDEMHLMSVCMYV